MVAATGTGKTWVSAFDYRRLRDAGTSGCYSSLIATRSCEQSQLVFQLVLKDPSFGERLVARERPVIGDHVFASIQSHPSPRQ